MNPNTDSPHPPGGASQGGGTRWPDQESRPPLSSPPPPEAFHQAARKFGELREFAAYYVSVRLDMIKVSIRNAGIYLAIAILGLIAVATMAITAVVLLLRGIAGGFAQLFSSHPWIGDLITAGLALAVLGIGIVFAMKKLTGTFRSLTVKKYEDRLRQERQQFGRDVREQAESVERSGR